MDKKAFIDLIGENPEDMFGGDWKNKLEGLTEEDFFCPRNNCGNPIVPEDNICGDCAKEQKGRS